MSTITNGGQSLPPPPSSHLISAHLQRLQSNFANRILGSAENRLSVPSISTIGDLSSTAHDIGSMHMSGCSIPDRRMSEPVNFGTANDKSLHSPKQRPRSVTPTKLENTNAMKINNETNAIPANAINVEQGLDVSIKI